MGDQEGDFYHSSRTIDGASATVADRGVIKLAPGTYKESILENKGKSFKILAPIGGVVITS